MSVATAVGLNQLWFLKMLAKAWRALRGTGRAASDKRARERVAAVVDLARAKSPEPPAVETPRQVPVVPPLQLPVEDDDAWVYAKIERRDGGEVWSVRQRYANSPPSTDLVGLEAKLSEAELAELSPAPDDFRPPANLTDLEQISTAAVLHTLRLRHESDQI